MLNYFIGYIIIINSYTFYLIYSDKKRARNKKWRIPEKKFFIFSILGGSIGTIASMKIFRHKTKHWYFKYGIPSILIFQILIIYIFYKLKIVLFCV
ncbi:Uncharacterized membrane protein YsdA, DUF1294 family [Clostridium cavendishii DSM 21758]|uniref:Uncharacterized membrane protein YsdA, DUF1294 family n=1 Tax=Clostridium cavendishii DSM 21758 TaxID=1121302 RepID=A0A1M6B7S8_9CLOT|nr:DUF1294 domain-containing protein [Clostridium cavendishii]SHI44791.1 Uncharacterized membrane protein YsdA, DUF1294 family [Clostridium cavendishii DSM 21758]